jgi:anion-transporting  ArsA/GET3 family ATPase
MTLLDKRLLIVGGKGGVGKSVVASALALLAAQQGRRTLLLGVDTLDRFSSLLGYQSQGQSLNEVSENLFCSILNPKSVADDFIEMHMPIRTLSKKISKSNLFNYWFEATPMLSELLMLGKIWRLVNETKRKSADFVWDSVIVEAPATGHSLGLLGASETAAQLLAGPMRSKANEITAMLRDATTTNLVITTLAEDMPVAEALELRKQARQKLGMTVAPLIVNAVFPDLVNNEDLESLQGPSSYPADLADSLGEACRYAIERRERSVHFLDVIKKECPNCIELPLITAHSFAREQVEQVAELLGARL